VTRRTNLVTLTGFCVSFVSLPQNCCHEINDVVPVLRSWDLHPTDEFLRDDLGCYDRRTSTGRHVESVVSTDRPAWWIDACAGIMFLHDVFLFIRPDHQRHVIAVNAVNQQREGQYSVRSPIVEDAVCQSCSSLAASFESN
jgi:hypothetical protein